jgi:hypothetical protein
MTWKEFKKFVDQYMSEKGIPQETVLEMIILSPVEFEDPELRIYIETVGRWAKTLEGEDYKERRLFIS